MQKDLSDLTTKVSTVAIRNLNGSLNKIGQAQRAMFSEKYFISGKKYKYFTRFKKATKEKLSIEIISLDKQYRLPIASRVMPSSVTSKGVVSKIGTKNRVKLDGAFFALNSKRHAMLVTRKEGEDYMINLNSPLQSKKGRKKPIQSDIVSIYNAQVHYGSKMKELKPRLEPIAKKIVEKSLKLLLDKTR
ncbi:hypothetical protein [Helicobacter sp. 11S02629-2]|uniref:hypothetical protein n=1 Tax=Helicobacter sp. 11S02629-2 TaxID=1476195 RepID=UPI000BA4F926|nr:hypothetical protein [Helicobacter sp. 11S02629-2]PAF44163.1 hypothetical protein BKH40_06090 [Helicobacter sp. 11S02629-2]